jgi:hypothetical protein
MVASLDNRHGRSISTKGGFSMAESPPPHDPAPQPINDPPISDPPINDPPTAPRPGPAPDRALSNE